MRRAQQGITLIGFVMILILLGGVAYIAMRLIPMYTEYFSVVKALNGIIQEPGIDTMDQLKIRDLLSRRFDISYVDSIEPKDVKITHQGGGTTLSVEYEVRKPVAYNIDLIGHFKKSVTTSTAAKAGDG